MKSITALSKYLGCYERWKATCKQYNLRWSTGTESIDSLARFFNPNLTLESMLDKVKEMMRVLPATMAAIIRFACITGLLPSEACESVRLLNIKKFEIKQIDNYYNPERQTLEHFRFPEIFIRRTKKAYISFVTADMLPPDISGAIPTYNSIRLACSKRRINMDMRYCRKIFASWLRQSGIQPEVVDLLQGRVSTSVLTRHYLVPQTGLKERVLDAVEELKKRLIDISL